jgi:hypothetical protein
MSVAPIRSSPVRRSTAGAFQGAQDHAFLRQGATGAEVRLLQEKLKAAGIDVTVNGQFDAGTEEAVRKYQQERGLLVDGLVGQQTWGSFYGQSLPPGTSMLKSSNVGGVSGVSGVSGGGPSSSAPTTAPHLQDRFEDRAVGPGKQVNAYVNGRPTTITVVPVGGGEFLRTDAAKAYLAMIDAAKRDGIHLSSTSGFRTNEEQQVLFNRYGPGRAARPGYSNHQNGISMDIGGVNGYGTPGFNWLKSNAARFGFVNDVPGEWWHWTFKR